MRRFSPYNYGFDNPIRFIDPDGMFSSDVTKNDDGTFTVVDSKVDGDKNIYVRDSEGNRTGEVIGETLTVHTFINDDGSAATGAQIKLADNSGAEFLNDVTGENAPGLVEYMANATPFEKYDFKREGLDEDQVAAGGEPTSYYYRGMPVNGAKALGIDGEKPVIGSARDVGNVAAGFVAGSNGLNWPQARLGLDGLEKIKQGSIGASEASVSQIAQRVGYNAGRTEFKRENPLKAMMNPVIPFPPR